jgi:hypothetical protein
MSNKKVLMVIPHMVGGGAERVAAQIMNKLNEFGYDTRFILTSAKKDEVVRSDLNEKTELIPLTEECRLKRQYQKIAHMPERVCSTVLESLEKQKKYVPAAIGKMTIDCSKHRESTDTHYHAAESRYFIFIVFLSR